MKIKPEIVLLVGNIGSGKTTLVKRILSKGFSHVVISRDALRYMIGAGRYRFDSNIESAIWDSELNIVKNFMNLKQNLLIDEVGLSKSMRKRYIDLAKQFDYDVTVIELPKFSKRVSVNHRMKDPHQCPDRKLWEGVWEKFDKLYERPTKSEGFAKIIRRK